MIQWEAKRLQVLKVVPDGKSVLGLKFDYYYRLGYHCQVTQFADYQDLQRKGRYFCDSTVTVCDSIISITLHTFSPEFILPFFHNR